MTIGLDYVAARFGYEQLPAVLAALQPFLGVPEEQEHGRDTYRESATFSTGGGAAWTTGRADCHVKLSGGSCAQWASPLALLRLLQKHGAHFTRLDLRIDDHSRQLIDLDKVTEAVEAGNVARFRRAEPRQPIANVLTGELAGRSWVFGRRGGDGSGRYVRIYDKGLESKGEIDCIRLELEASGDYCREVARVLLMCEDDGEWCRLAGQYVVGSIDFVNRACPSAHGHLDRMPLLDWWARVVDAVGGGLRLKLERVKVELRESLDYLRSAFSRRLAQAAVVVEQTGHDSAALLDAFVRDLVAVGRPKVRGWVPGPVELSMCPVELLGLSSGGGA